MTFGLISILHLEMIKTAFEWMSCVASVHDISLNDVDQMQVLTNANQCKTSTEVYFLSQLQL